MRTHGQLKKGIIRSPQKIFRTPEIKYINQRIATMKE